jgi:hypothetical protein
MPDIHLSSLDPQKLAEDPMPKLPHSSSFYPLHRLHLLVRHSSRHLHKHNKTTQNATNGNKEIKQALSNIKSLPSAHYLQTNKGAWQIVAASNSSPSTTNNSVVFCFRQLIALFGPI